MTRDLNEKKLWGYPMSFKITTAIIILGFFIQIVSNSKVPNIVFPNNIIFGITFIIISIISHIFLRNTKIFKSLSSIPASISAIVGVTILVGFMGSIPQNGKSENTIIHLLGLDLVTSSWAFILISLYLLFILALVCIQRTVPFKIKNLGFIFSHLGLWICLFAGSLGSGDLQRLSMDLEEKQITWKAHDSKGTYYELPLAIKLLDFSIENFEPKIAIIDNLTGVMCEEEKPFTVMISDSLKCKLQHYDIEVIKYLPYSGRIGDMYSPVRDFGSSPSVKVKVTNKENISVIGWVTCGSFNMLPESLTIDENFSLVMTVPEVKKFSSVVTIFTPDGEKINTTLEVNKPITVNSWKIYQLSYDEKMGKYSTKSTLELIKDPWQKVVYLGIFMMMIGAVFMFMMGNKIKD